MAYNPLVPPQNPEELLTYLNDEFARVAAEYNALQNGEWRIWRTMPTKYRPGMVIYLDGVGANPLGTGLEGIYRFGLDNAWHYVG